MKNYFSSPLLVLSIVILLVSCLDNNPNLNNRGEDKLEAHLQYTDQSIQHYRDTSYIPIYSDIYSNSRFYSVLLTATLSIRSTSVKDTTYINSIEYYNTRGELVNSYIDKTLVLGPMETVDYVIDREDNTGGTGANFLVSWGAKRNTKPLFQAVMISTVGQHGLSFVVDGVSLKNKE